VEDRGFPSFSIIHLKQIRDAKQTDLACYQALVSSTVALKFLKQTYLPPAKITIHRYDSLRITDVPGIETGVLYPTEHPELIVFDMTFSQAKNLTVLPSVQKE